MSASGQSGLIMFTELSHFLTDTVEKGFLAVKKIFQRRWCIPRAPM
jgi:hypothetical protein